MGIFFLGVSDSQKKSTPAAPAVVSQSDSGSERPFNNGASFLTFSDVTFNGKLPIIDYEVSAVAEDDTSSGATLGSLVSYVFTGLRSGIKYRYRARARNTLGYGPYSSFLGPFPATTVPGTPTSVSAIDLRTGGQLFVSWNAPANGGLSVTGYTIYPSTGSPIETNDPSTSYTFTGTVGTPYTFTVAAKNSNGRGSQSAGSSSATPTNPPVTVVTTTTTVAGPSIGFSTNTSATGTSSNNQWGVNVSWVGFGYASYRITGAGCDTGIINGTATNRVVTCAAAQCNQTVSVTVTLYSGTGGSGASASSTASNITTPSCPQTGGPITDAPPPDPCAGTTTVPNITGLTPTQAGTLLAAAGLSNAGSTGTVTTSNSSLNGQVASQSVASGTSVNKCSNVSYTTYSYVAPVSSCTSQVAGGTFSGACPDGSCSGCTSYRVYYGTFPGGGTDTSRICRYEGLNCTTCPYWGAWVDVGQVTTYGCNGLYQTTTTCSSAQTRFYYDCNNEWVQSVAPETRCIGTTTTTQALVNGQCGYAVTTTTPSCTQASGPCDGSCCPYGSFSQDCTTATGQPGTQTLCITPQGCANYTSPCVATVTTTTAATTTTTTTTTAVTTSTSTCGEVVCCTSASACGGCGGYRLRNTCTSQTTGLLCNDCPPATTTTTAAVTTSSSAVTSSAVTTSAATTSTSAGCACRDFRGRCVSLSFCIA